MENIRIILTSVLLVCAMQIFAQVITVEKSLGHPAFNLPEMSTSPQLNEFSLNSLPSSSSSSVTIDNLGLSPSSFTTSEKSLSSQGILESSKQTKNENLSANVIFSKSDSTTTTAGTTESEITSISTSTHPIVTTITDVTTSSNGQEDNGKDTTSPEVALIPPAAVTANIAEMSPKPNRRGQIIITSAENDCPSLEDADSLSQTQLIMRLTHVCRYDRLERPISYGEKGERLPTKVYARAYIYFLQDLEAHDLQFKVHLLLQLRYVDPRLVFKKVAPSRTQKILGEESLRKLVWLPHIFFPNERESSILGTDQKDVLISISPDGTVILSARIHATLYCWMNLKKFPFDDQQCPMQIESWMYNTTELTLSWEKTSPVTVVPELHLTEYVLLNTSTNESVINADLRDLRHGAFAGNYSSLSFTVHLAREMGFYLIDYFLPSMMIVAISWVSFWLQADQSAPRIMLGTSTMLTFITLATAQGKTLPKVSYIKVSEIWFLGCTGFIFGSLVEFAFVNTIWRRKKNVELKKVNSKYILKSTLTPKPLRKEFNLHKSRSCSSLNVSASTKNQLQTYDNYLTVHAFPSKNSLPTIKTESVDDLIQENGSVKITMEPDNMNSSNSINQDSLAGTNHGWTTMTPQEISMWIDRRSRFVFPCAFVVFNAFFWTFVYCL